jgi:putative transposase
MTQMARNITMVDWGFLSPGQYLIDDRDGKYCLAFQQMIEAVGAKPIALPPRSPNLNAYAERWIRSVKDETLSRLILFGERSLRYALHEYVTHYHTERPHQGKGNVVLMPSPPYRAERHGPIHCHERLGGLLKYYAQEAV